MIIEAGYDLFELFAPKLFAKPHAKGGNGTWVLALDENLRNQHMAKVGGDASDAIENRIPKFVKALNKRALRPVTYYAVAHLDTELHGGYSEPFEHFSETLRLAPELIEHELLSIYFSNGKSIYSDGPRYSFRDYFGYEYLPRNATIPGPHEYPCACLACTQHDEMLRRNRERYEATTTDES